MTSYIYTHWKLKGLRPAESDDGEEGDGPAVATSYRWVLSMALNQPPRLYHREATFDRSGILLALSATGLTLFLTCCSLDC